MSFDLTVVRRRDRELGDYIEDIAEQPLSFQGSNANYHSYENHRHLWLLEYAAERHAFVDLAFREQAVRYILDRWRARLPGYAASSPNGFRLYCYADMAPTVSVVGETGEGCPYGGDPVFVMSLGEVLEPYTGRSWSENFVSAGIGVDTILKALRRHDGSLRRGAQALGLPLADLRRRIEAWGIAPDVNRIRKHHKRRPAAFRREDYLPMNFRIYEERVPSPR